MLPPPSVLARRVSAASAPSLLINNLGIRGAAQAKHGQPVEMRQRLWHGRLERVGIRRDERAHVENRGRPAGNDERCAFALKLRQNQAGQYTCVDQCHFCRCGHRSGGTAGFYRRVDRGQALASKKEQLFERLSVVAQPAGYINVAGADRVAAQRILAACDGRGHLNDVRAASQIVGDKDVSAWSCGRA